MPEFNQTLTLRDNPRIKLGLAFERTLDPGVFRAVVTYQPPISESDIAPCIEVFKKIIPGGIYLIERRKDPEAPLQVAFYTTAPDQFVDMVEKHCEQAINDRVRQSASALLQKHIA